MATLNLETVRVAVDAHIATLCLSRPDRRNALNVQMCRDLVTACEALDADASVRVVLVRGEGATFCAGADLKERQTMQAADMVARRVDGFTAYAALERMRKPTIAVVHGPAFGSGCEIASACDFVLASADAVFCYPEVGWGTVGATQRLPRIVGRRMAKELLFTGRKVAAEEARVLGLVNHVHSPDELDAHVQALAERIAQANPLTVMLTKRSIDVGLDATREGAMAQELLAIQENLRHSDWQKAISTFGRPANAASPPTQSPPMPLNAHHAPIAQTLARALAQTVAARGAYEAYVDPSERRTWSAIEQSAIRMAKSLLHAGVRRGDHVGILLGNASLWMETFFGCALIGAVAVPVNTRFKADELQYCLRQADVNLLIYAHEFLGIDFSTMLAQVEPALCARLPGLHLPALHTAVCVGGNTIPAGATALRTFLDAGANVSHDAFNAAIRRVTPADVLLIQYTSGTTAYPKGVMLTHANILGNAASVARRIGVAPQDRYFSVRPFFHVAGSTLSILVSLVSGCCLLSLPKFDVAQTLDVLDRERCTLMSGNDTIFLMLMGHPRFDKARLHLRGGWAAAGPEVMHKIHDVMGVPHMCNAYGQSEASPNVLVSDWDDALQDRCDGFMRPHPGVDVRLADAQTDIPMAETLAQGEIQVRGWNVMRGYYQQPEATAKAFTADGWLKTGDLGKRNAHGRIRMVARLKDLFRVGGENVAPADVEEVLHAHPAVQQAQVIGVPDARLGEVAAAFVLLREGGAADCTELIAWCRARCANFKVPRYLDIVASFAPIGMTGSAKIQKHKLREYAIQTWRINANTIAPAP